MLFNSLDFWLFLPLVWGAYALLPAGWRRVRTGMLLAASYFFYSYWDVRFLGLIVLSTGVDFWVARRMEDKHGGARRRWLALSIGVNLGILGAFKYFGFFVDSAAAICAAMGWPVEPVTLDLVLPIGISFYTFQTLGYTIDVYRGQVQAEREPLTFALFVAFFPQLMAGPIERASRLLPQLHAPLKPDLRAGFPLFLRGMVKKVAISSTLWSYAQMLYLNPEALSTGMAWMLAGIMLVHIYMDFSGYSDMAVGLGRMFGVRLSRNFDQVFRSQGFPDLWRRWHITLGRWFRDYLYFPLLRRGMPRNAAILLTFSVIGLWHGPRWTLALWGVGMGVAWVADNSMQWPQRLRRWNPRLQAIGSLVTLAVFAWLSQLFPVEEVGKAWQLQRTMLGWPGPQAMGFSAPPRAVWVALLLFVALEWNRPGTTNSTIVQWFERLVLYPIGIALCIEGLWQSREFVYFQF